jgi:hypothetical protein
LTSRLFATHWFVVFTLCALFNFFFASKIECTNVRAIDQTIEIPMSDEDMEPFVFALVQMRQERRLRKNLKDLENYTGLTKTTRLPASLALLTDCPELERDLIDDKVVTNASPDGDVPLSTSLLLLFGCVVANPWQI